MGLNKGERAKRRKGEKGKGTGSFNPRLFPFDLRMMKLKGCIYKDIEER